VGERGDTCPGSGQQITCSTGSREKDAGEDSKFNDTCVETKQIGNVHARKAKTDGVPAPFRPHSGSVPVVEWGQWCGTLGEMGKPQKGLCPKNPRAVNVLKSCGTKPKEQTLSRNGGGGRGDEPAPCGRVEDEKGEKKARNKKGDGFL